MKHNFRYLSTVGLIAIVVTLLTSCSNDPDSPGYEYMPDMYRSPAVEAYVDYGMDPYYVEDSIVNQQRMTMSARQPVPGTIPFSEDPEKAMYNFPYPFPNTTAGYDSAGKYLKNPVMLTDEVLADGKEIYVKFCTHCHGDKGDGQGKIVQNGKLSGIPAYTAPAVANLEEGKMFHSITNGKGLMGAHASQLSKEERWKVIHYIMQELQGRGATDMGATPAEGDTLVTPVVEEVPVDGGAEGGHGEEHNEEHE